MEAGFIWGTAACPGGAAADRNQLQAGFTRPPQDRDWNLQSNPIAEPKVQAKYGEAAIKCYVDLHVLRGVFIFRSPLSQHIFSKAAEQLLDSGRLLVNWQLWLILCNHPSVDVFFALPQSGLFQDTAASLGANMTSKNVVFKKICKDKSVSEVGVSF